MEQQACIQERVHQAWQMHLLLRVPPSSQAAKLMVEPVIAADGHTYERSAMEHWLQQNDTSPVTHLPLPHKRLVPNVVIRSAILNHPQPLQWH
ncbi:TPA: hypothetical protein ACH3X3_009173 [Trebouxia sp. C0006]